MTLSGFGEKTPLKSNAGICSRFAVCILCATSACCARGMQAPGVAPPTSHVRVATKAAPPTAPATGASGKQLASARGKEPEGPLAPSDTVAIPATVSLKDGKLTVDANNSDLGEILRHVAVLSGMTIDGLNKSARVFGVYGPGNPRDVLTDLLDGFGYNFMMVGGAPDGAPRELLLTAENHNAPAPAPTNPPAAAPDDSDLNELGPGAIAPTPQVALQNAEDSSTRMQQTLQRLEQLHELQDQQNPPQ